MRCPYCDADKDRVIDSRASEEGRSIRRRRECLACGKRFTTYEHVEERTRRVVIKKDGSRVPYDRSKVLAGLEKSCFKRPISAETQLKLIEEVEEELFARHEKEIASLEIGQAVADRLKRLDHVAYVRFASVYKQFRDLEDFLAEVRDVLNNPSDPPNQGTLF